MNQVKLEVVKQGMARVNVDILGISKLKSTGMGEFNSDDHYIYYCEQESLKRNGIAIIVNQRVRNAVLECNLKNDRMISVRFQGKPFSITISQVYAPTSNAEEAERFYKVKLKVTQSCLTLCNPINRPWNSPDQNTGVGSLSLLQGIFPTQGANPGLPHCRRILYQLSHKRGPRTLEWVA